MNILFKQIIKPNILIISQPDNTAEMNKKIRIVYNDSVSEEIELAQREGPQKFVLQNPIQTNQIKIQVVQV